MEDMKKQKRWMQAVVFAAVVLLGGYTIVEGIRSPTKAPGVGDQAPHFALSAVDGRTYELSGLRGKVVLVNFWGSWCEPCKREMPAIENQYRKWKSSGFEVLAVNIGESAVTVKGFMEQYGLTFPALYDPNESVRKKYGVVVYPTSFFIDANGVIRLKREGEMDEPMIERIVVSLLS